MAEETHTTESSSTTAPAGNTQNGFALIGQILFALALAVVAGILLGKESFGIHWSAWYSFFGGLFLNALKMITVPLVASSIIVGVAGVGAGQFGRLGGQVLGLYFLTTLLAVLTAILVINLIHPGTDDQGVALYEQITLPELSGDWQTHLQSHSAGDMMDVFRRMVPENIFAAASTGDMLAVIVFCLLFGFFLAQSPSGHQHIVLSFFTGVHDIMLRITQLIMRAAPFGVFALVADVVANTGMDVFVHMLGFMFAVILALAVHSFISLPLLLRFFAGVPALRHFKAMAPAILTAFSTASSAATLPVTIDCVERRAGISKRISSLVLPLGATVNMNGTALYECAAVLFIAQAYGVSLSFETQFMVALLALATSIGVAAIPSASLVAIGLILTNVGLPMEAMALLLIVDRVLDMLRTSVNILGDTVVATIIARREGEEGVLGLPACIRNGRACMEKRRAAEEDGKEAADE